VSNPTGSTYLQANNTYTWADGDIYEIPQTDQVEGAATGASFSGLGVDNQPHQVLLNKIQLTHKNQITDEANISTLLTFKSLFTSLVGVSGYFKVGVQDSVKGQIDVVVQWGTISLIGQTGGGDQLAQSTFTFNFPIAFPNAIWVLYPYWQVNNQAESQHTTVQTLIAGIPLIVPLTPLAKQGNTFGIGSATIETAQNASDDGITGIGWWALGY